MRVVHDMQAPEEREVLIEITTEHIEDLGYPSREEIAAMLKCDVRDIVSVQGRGMTVLKETDVLSVTVKYQSVVRRRIQQIREDAGL